MNRETPGALLLFELIARRWAVPVAAKGLVFSLSQNRLAAPLADGRVALIDCADPEPPDGRIAVDSAGRRAIAPRRIEPRPAMIAGAAEGEPARVAPGAGDGFLVAMGDASLFRLDPDGTTTRIVAAGGSPLIGFDRRAAATLVVTRDSARLTRDAGPTSEGRPPAGVHAAALSPDGATIAYGSETAIELARSGSPGDILRRYEAPGPVSRIVWRDDGAFVAAACDEGGLLLVELQSGRSGTIGGFPAPPSTIAFSVPANALVASGAYRIAAWSLARPPFDGDRSGALETGRPGRVEIAAVAAHPSRKLVAAAFADGAVAIAEPGRRDEMPLKGAGAAPAALAWSADGRMLAIAAADSVAIASLPDALFK